MTNNNDLPKDQLPWRTSYKIASEAQPSWTKHGMPSLTEKFISLVRNSDTKNGIHLDIGCGDGIKTVNFAFAGFKTIGVDMSEEGFESGLRRIRKLKVSRRCKLIKGSMLEIPIKETVAHSASDILCFTHLKLKDHGRYKCEIERVLKKGGYLLLVLFSDKDKHFHGHKVSRQYTFRFDPKNPLMEGFSHYNGMYNIHFNESLIRKTFQDKFEIVEMVEAQHPVYDYRYLWNVILKK